MTRLADVGYLDPAIPLDQLDETLAEGLTVRVAADGHYVPSVELKFATDQYSCASLVDPVTVRLSDGDLLIDSLELQIAYKLWMGAQKDFEDALYLYHLLGSTVNTARSNHTLLLSVSLTNMTSSDLVDDQLARNKRDPHTFIKSWVEYVRTHPDDDWSIQINRLVDSQLDSARQFEDLRPNLDALDSPLLKE